MLTHDDPSSLRASSSSSGRSNTSDDNGAAACAAGSRDDHNGSSGGAVRNGKNHQQHKSRAAAAAGAGSRRGLRQQQQPHHHTAAGTSRRRSSSSSRWSILVRTLLLSIAAAAAAGIYLSVSHVHRIELHLLNTSHGGNTARETMLGDFFSQSGRNNAVHRGDGPILAVPADETRIGFKEKDKSKQQQPDSKNAITEAHQRRGVDAVAGDHSDARRYPPLQCAAFGGPTSEQEAQEMVYWQDIPSDSHYVSPFHPNNRKDRPRQYMTFEPDGGGWNNIRMAMETVVGLAIATGRILVLPPEQRMYLLAQGRGKEKTDFSFKDFFPFEQLTNDNDGLTTISMQEFLETEWGNLRNKVTGEIEYPPNNRTNWDGQDVKVLKEWLRNVTHTPHWAPQACTAVFPASGDHKDALQLQSMHEQIVRQGMPRDEYIDNPVPVDGTTMERMREHLATRKQLCMYDEEMQKEFVVHFMCYHKERVRLLTHFYAFLFFEDWRDDLWMKRFMRDHMRYIDELQCAAARIVAATRKRALEKDPASKGEFDTFHVRRGDFQFKATRIDADEIYKNVKDKMQEGATVFIATDERDKKFFDPLKKHYNVLFLDDFKKELEGVNKNFYGMIDQLVASRGRLFFGCWHSTFTGFIMRMRGYFSVKEKLPGHEQGLLFSSYYYVPKPALERMHRFAPLMGAFFNREFPVSWRDLDVGVGKLPHVMDH